MSGYVESYFEQFQGPIGCGINPPTTTTVSDCALWIIVGVVLLSLAFEKKRKVPTK
jgi:hypothetical protein